MLTVRRDGNHLSGIVEGRGDKSLWRQPCTSLITEAKIERNQVSFKARNSPYSRTVKGDQIELEPKINFGFRMPPSPEAPAGRARPLVHRRTDPTRR